MDDVSAFVPDPKRRLQHELDELDQEQRQELKSIALRLQSEYLSMYELIACGLRLTYDVRINKKDC